MAVEPFNENYTMPREDGHQGWTRILESMVERRKGDGSRWRWKERKGQMKQKSKVRREVKREWCTLSSSASLDREQAGIPSARVPLWDRQAYLASVLSNAIHLVRCRLLLRRTILPLDRAR